MTERHSIEFDRVIFNVISDADRQTITLQFEHNTPSELKTIKQILSAISWRFGAGITSRLRRWTNGQDNPLALPARATPHPECPDILCFEIGVRQGVRMENALAALLDRLRQLPGYRRTHGMPLDPDDVPVRPRNAPPRDVSIAAAETLWEFFKRRQKRQKGI